jgi:hypothetical protein
MNTRIRAAVLSAVAVVAAGLLNVTGAAPAQALGGQGETCMDPYVRGTIQRVVGQNSFGFPTVYAEFKQTGYTEANCPAPYMQNRYKVTFAYDGRTVSTYQSEIEPVYRPTPTGFERAGTRIDFPTLRMTFGGYEDVQITVTSGSKSVFSSVWCRSDEVAYEKTINAEQWGADGYSTKFLAGITYAKVNACP